MLSVVGSLTAATVFPKLSDTTNNLTSFMTKNTGQLSQMQTDLTQAGAFLSKLQGANTTAQSAIDTANALQTASQAAINGLSTALAAAGIHVYAGSTTPSSLGAPMTADLGGTGAQTVWAVVLVADNSAAWTALQAIVKTS